MQELQYLLKFLPVFEKFSHRPNYQNQQNKQCKVE